MNNIFSVYPHKGFLNTKFTIVANVDDLLFFELPLDENNRKLKALWTGAVKSTSFNLPCGKQIIRCNYKGQEYSENVEVLDAIRLGGSQPLGSFVFDNNPWILITMKDRTYFINRDTNEQYYENNISPDNVLEINAHYLLFSCKSEDEYGLYSTDEHRIVKYVSNLSEYNTRFLIQFDDNVLTIYDLETNIEHEYACGQYKAYFDKGFIAFSDYEGRLHTINLSTLEESKSTLTLLVKNFLETPHALVYSDKRPYNVGVHSLDDSGTKWFKVEEPIAKWNKREIIDVTSLKAKIENGQSDIKQLVELECYIVGEQVIHIKKYLNYDEQKNSFIGGIVKIYNDKQLLTQMPSNELYSIINRPECLVLKVRNGIVCIDEKMWLLRIPNADILETPNHLLYYIRETEKTIFYTFLKEQYLSLDETNIIDNKSYLGIIKVGDKYFDIDRKKWLPYKKLETFVLDIAFEANSDLCHLYIDHKDRIVDAHFRNIYNNELSSISPSGNYIVIKKGEQYQLAVYNQKNNTYSYNPIVLTNFDNSQYQNALYTDGESEILCKKNNNYICYNLKTGAEVNFENANFIVRSINGYRPIVARDKNRRPVLKDPITLDFVSQELISQQYAFVSPSGRYRAEYKRLFRNKVTDEIVDEIEKNSFLKDYNIEFYPKPNTEEAKLKETHIQNRIKLYEQHPDLFKDEMATKEYIESMSLDRLEQHVFNEIVSISDSILMEEIRIEAEGVFWFKNYISFSYDDRYIAIAARYRNGYDVGGYFGMYDLLDKNLKISMLQYENENDNDKKENLYAVWMTAFTKNGTFAFYTSEPHTFIGDIDKNIKRIQGHNFLCFSPDGRYMALSQQGYKKYDENDVSESWGHQKSSWVYVYDTKTLKKLDEWNCYFGSQISGVQYRKENVASVAFSQDNKQLLVSSDDGVVVIYNLSLK